MDPILGALLLGYLLKNGFALAMELAYLLRRQTSPYMQLRMAREKRRAEAAGRRPATGWAGTGRHAARDFAAGLWHDSWDGATTTRQKIRARRADRLAEGTHWAQRTGRGVRTTSRATGRQLGRVGAAAGVTAVNAWRAGSARLRSTQSIANPPVHNSIDQEEQVLAEPEQSRDSTVPADATRTCGCGGTLRPYGPAWMNEVTGTAQVSLHCDRCELESAHLWALSDTEYETAFGHRFGESPAPAGPNHTEPLFPMFGDGHTVEIASGPYFGEIGTVISDGPLRVDQFGENVYRVRLADRCSADVPEFQLEHTDLPIEPDPDLLEMLIAVGELGPAARDMPLERVLAHYADANALSRGDRSHLYRRAGVPIDATDRPSTPEPRDDDPAAAANKNPFIERNTAMPTGTAHTGETTNITSALDFAKSMAENATAAATSVETAMATMQAEEVTGRPIELLGSAHEQLTTLAGTFTDVHKELEQHLTIGEAYASVGNDAGSKDFNTLD